MSRDEMNCVDVNRKTAGTEDEMQGDLEASRMPNQGFFEEGEGTAQSLLLKDDEAPSDSIQENPTSERIASLDVFRGLTVAAMILVDYAGALWWGIDHAPWDGVTFADFVVPAFLFIVGVSIALAYKTTNNPIYAACKLVVRVLKLFGLGMLLQSGYFHAVNDLSYGVDIQQMRIMGVLQRIAIAYGVVACSEIFLSRPKIQEASGTSWGIIKDYRWHWVAAGMLTCLYLGLLYGIYVPTWQFVAPEATSSMDMNNLVAKTSLLQFAAPEATSAMDMNSLVANTSLLQVDCGVRGSLSPGCNAVSFVDRSVMGISHLHKRPPYRRTEACSTLSPYAGPLPEGAPAWCMAPFDPEGLLSSIPAVTSCFIGVHYGHILLLVKGHKRRVWQWVNTSAALIFTGLTLDMAGIPLNKQLYSVSYLFLTGGAVGLTFVVVYVTVDIYKWRRSTLIFKWVGAHALMIYALISCNIVPLALQGLFWKSSDNNLIEIIRTALGFS